MNLSIVLPLRNQTQLTSLLNSLYDPSSAKYHHFLTVKEFVDQFGPTTEDYQKVVDFVGANGLEARTTAPANRMILSLTGSVAQVEKAFGVKMRRYQHPTEAREFFSPDREPSVPSGLPIRHIAGMSDYSQPKSMARRSLTGTHTVDVQGSGPGGNYMASDMRAAYYGGTALTGRGQTLGLVQFDGYNIADVISAFNGEATLSTLGTDSVVNYTPPGSQTTYAVPIHNVLLDQATGAPGQFISPAEDGEQVLDIVESIGMAPGLSQVRMYIGNNDVDVLSAIASENLANEVSISWAWTPDDPSTVDQFFEEMASQGQSVFVASGDYGAYSPLEPFYFPAEDPWVTAVGGTHLTTDGPGGPLVLETAWNQSGGGVSPDAIPIPNWQTAVVNSSNRASATLRNVPDVAMEADFDNFNCNLGECWGGWAGTSFASPRWAGFTALVNEQAIASGDSPAGFLNPGIYTTGQGPDYGSQFHDVVTGQTDFESGYGFYAVPGYDLTTGWGSPTGQNLIDALAPKSSVGFQLTTTQSGLTIGPGSSASTTIGVIDVGGFSGDVSLAVTSPLPSGVSVSFSGNPTSTTSVLTLDVSILAAAQTFVVTVTGTSSSAQATTYLTVNVPTNAVVVLSPAPPPVPVIAQWVKPSMVIPINAIVIGQPQSIQLTWAPGISPASGWTSAGIAQNQTLTPPFSNVTIGTWDTSSITTAGYYTVQVSAVYMQGTVSATTLVYIEPDLVSGNWPKFLIGNPSSTSGAVPVSDTSGNTLLAVMEPNRLGESSEPLYEMFSVDGSRNESATLLAGGAGSAYGSLAPGHPGGSIMGDSERVIMVGPDATINSLPLDGVQAEFVFEQIVLSTLGGNSSLATLTVGNQDWNNIGFLFAWGADGNLLNSNFPVQYPSANFAATSCNNQKIIVGDMNGDGNREVVVLESPTASTFTLVAFNSDGTSQSGWQAPTFQGMPYEMIFADLDHNGKHELILPVQDNTTGKVSLHALEPDGSERSGWPVDVGFGPIYLAAGDLSNTGNMEVVVGGGQYLSVLNSDGTSYSDSWPISSYAGNNTAGFGAIVLADIDGNGQTEILTTNSLVATVDNSALPQQTPSIVRQSSGSKLAATYVDAASGENTTTQYWAAELNAYRLDGSIAKSWQLPGINGLEPCCTPQVTVGDFNHDGLTEIAVVDALQESPESGWQYHAVMEVLATGTAFNPSANLWPSLYRDTWNSATADFVGPASAPTLSVAAGRYAQAQTVSLFDTTPGATIYYTTDGTTPGTSSAHYTGPISVSSSETIQAIAIASAYTVSSLASASYSIAPSAATPTFSVTPGTYTTTQTVAISDSTPGAVIYYTTNGTTPTTSSYVYSGPITVSSTETLEAIASGNGYSASAVAMAAYIINLPAARPTFSVTPGTYTSAQTVTISDATPDAEIYYTTNGSTPTTSSTPYSVPITVSSSEIIQAIATASGYSQSAVASAAYIINLPAATPTFSVTPGTYTSAQTVTISDSTPGAVIYYTTNGSMPTTSSTPYSVPIAVSRSETIEAIATAPGHSQSAFASADYTISIPVPGPSIASLSPAYASAGSSRFQLTVNGSGFILGSTVYWGSTALSTQFASATQLTASVPAADIAAAGTSSIAVQNLGGGTSGTLQFEIDSASSGSSAAPTFTTTSASVSAGNSAIYPVTLRSTVSDAAVSCLNLPTGSTCSYSASSGAVSIATSSSTPAGNYQVTAVFTETQSVSAGYVLAPFLLLPLMFLRRKLFANGARLIACLVLVLALGTIAVTGCAGGSTPVETGPTTHQVTSSGVVTLTVK